MGVSRTKSLYRGRRIQAMRSPTVTSMPTPGIDQSYSRAPGAAGSSDRVCRQIPPDSARRWVSPTSIRPVTVIPATSRAPTGQTTLSPGWSSSSDDAFFDHRPLGTNPCALPVRAEHSKRVAGHSLPVQRPCRGECVGARVIRTSTSSAEQGRELATRGGCSEYRTRRESTPDIVTNRERMVSHQEMCFRFDGQLDQHIENWTVSI